MVHYTILTFFMTLACLSAVVITIDRSCLAYEKCLGHMTNDILVDSVVGVQLFRNVEHLSQSSVIDSEHFLTKIFKILK